MSKLAKKVVFTSLSATLTHTQTQDSLFKTLILQKIRNKILNVGDTLEVVVFGKKCQFLLEEVHLQHGVHNGEKIVITDETIAEIYVEGGYTSSKASGKGEGPNFLASITKNLQDQSEENTPSEDICQEVGHEQVQELLFTFKFNQDDNVDDELKMKNIVVCGQDKSGKKTIVRRAILQYLKEQNTSEDEQEISTEEIFSFKKLKIGREPVSPPPNLVYQNLTCLES